MEILYQDDYFFAIDKAAGDFVHPPESSAYPTPKEKICLFKLRDHFQTDVYPVHRLDAPTSGVVIFAFTKESTRALSLLFSERKIRKTYHAVARGFVAAEGQIKLPLSIKGFSELMESETHFRCLSKIELPHAVGLKYQTARYSLVEVHPITGRWHQIRRHFNQTAHPLIGDIEHGDSHHNRFFRDTLKIPGLCLRAKCISFVHPWSQRPMKIEAPENSRWKEIYNLFLSK